MRSLYSLLNSVDFCQILTLKLLFGYLFIYIQNHMSLFKDLKFIEKKEN